MELGHRSLGGGSLWGLNPTGYTTKARRSAPERGVCVAQVGRNNRLAPASAAVFTCLPNSLPHARAWRRMSAR